jgi:hypothetical protein
MVGNQSLTGPRKPYQTDGSGLPTGLAGFPIGIFRGCKPDQVRFGEPCACIHALVQGDRKQPDRPLAIGIYTRVLNSPLFRCPPLHAYQ